MPQQTAQQVAQEAARQAAQEAARRQAAQDAAYEKYWAGVLDYIKNNGVLGRPSACV
jgi:hypothetical protein